MHSIKIQKLRWSLLLTVFAMSLSFAQEKHEKWSLQLALGVNNPLATQGHVGYYSEYINFPTINVGVHHLFTRTLGAKLDLGYNRSTERDGSLPFTLNYTRINLQATYNLKDILTFLPRRISIVAHAGPGVSMSNPLGDDVNNTYTYPNVLGGFELHYRISRSVSIFADGAYALSLSNGYKYDVTTDGFSFNGDVVYGAIGISLSLSNSNYCF